MPWINIWAWDWETPCGEQSEAMSERGIEIQEYYKIDLNDIN